MSSARPVVQCQPPGFTPRRAGTEADTVAEAEIRIREVKAVPTRSGNTRFVLVDANGNEYVTFREEVAASLDDVEGKRARISYHQQKRGRFTNVYLDTVDVLADDAEAEGDATADEIGWKTAVDAAPYLLGREAVEEETPPEEVFENPRRFKQPVAEDVEASDDDDAR